MALNFITEDPVGKGFDAQWARDEKVRLAREAYGVDEAIRGGLGDVMAGQLQQQAAPQQYASLPSSAPPSTMTDAGPSSAPASGGFSARIQGVEDPSGRAINPLGYTGAHQMGKAHLQTIGHYTPAAGENMQDNKVWSGQVTVPGMAPMTQQQFATNPDAQRAAMARSEQYYEQEIERRGLGAYVGRTIGGVQITPDSIKAMMHIGGVGGAEQFLKTGGQYNPSDINGTSISGYANRVSGGGGGGGGAPAGGQPNVMLADATASGIAMGGANSLPGQTGPNYNPILSRLQGVPGGGKVALDLLNRQGRTDVAQGRRLDQYQKLAMIAMGKGDVPTARYYAQLGGLQLPDAVFQDAGMMKRTAMGSLMAQRIYRTDAQAGQVFLQTYLRTGNADAAFAAAGSPRDNPSFSPVWVKGIENDLLFSFNRRDGTMTPAVNPGAPQGGAPAAPAMQPPAAAPPPAPSAPPPPGLTAGTEQGGPTGAGPFSLSAPPAPPPADPAPQAPQQAVPGPAAAAPAQSGVPGQISRPAATPGGGQARTPNAVVRQKMLIDAGMPPAQAAAIAAGAAPTANAMISAMGTAARIVDPMGTLEGPARQAAIGKWMDEAFGPTWRDRLRPPGGAQPGQAGGGGQPQYQPLTLAPAQNQAPAAPGRLPSAQQDRGTPQQAPPAAQRQRGTTYMTPRGPMVWTGTGWVSPTE